jgi:hypothetical protein
MDDGLILFNAGSAAPATALLSHDKKWCEEPLTALPLLLFS